MKKKILTLFLSLILVCTTLLLNSCFLLDGAFDASLNTGSGNTGTDLNINVQGGDNYDININSGEGNNILAASKALLSAVSVWATFECYQ